MRPRALLRVPAARRVWLCHRMMREADLADIFRLRTGQAHRRWGNGSLMASARRRLLAPEPRFDDAEYCACWRTVLTMLIDRKISRARS